MVKNFFKNKRFAEKLELRNLFFVYNF